MSDGIQYFLIFSLALILFVISMSFAKRSKRINKKTAHFFWRAVSIIALFLIILLIALLVYFFFIWQPAVIDLK